MSKAQGKKTESGTQTTDNGKTHGEVFLSENRGLEATRSETKQVSLSSVRVANTHDLRQKDEPRKEKR